MCGIAGFFNYKTGMPPSEPALRSVLESIRYRGPDHLGLLVEDAMGLGNVRLAIQGLDPTGNQPIYNEDKTVVVVFNGEIYNYPELRVSLEAKGHVFATHTDTEVLVHLYEDHGEQMARDLNGMFAFALYDKTKKRLLLGRDRTAQKPLFIHRNADGVFFCSELKAMLPYVAERRLNIAAAMTFLAMGYCLEPASIVEGITTLEPGTVLSIDSGGERTSRYFQPECAPSTHRYRSIDEWCEDADEVFQRAVDRHLLSDVPLTVFLSGGVDSSLLATYLTHKGLIRTAYTGSFLDATDHDEYPFARRLGDVFGFDVVRVPLSRQNMADQLEPFLAGSSQPQGDYSGLATFCIAEAAAASFKVVLGGDGADELFGGYPTYTYPELHRRWGFVPRSAIGLAHEVAVRLFDRQRYLALPFKLQQLRQAWGLDIPDAHYTLKCFLPDGLAALLLSDEFRRTAGPGDGPGAIREAFAELPDTDPLRRLPWVDFRTFLRSCTIPKVERNTMAFSLENRLPYLDNEVLELSLRTPTRFNVDGTATKLSLKTLLRRRLSGRVTHNPAKQGFSPPLRAMLKRELRDWRNASLARAGAVFAPQLASRFDELDAAGWDLHRLEWNVCILIDWCERNGIRLA